ncbi:MAG: zinc ribbon domain-containing protein [Opitutaceae bacterium]
MDDFTRSLLDSGKKRQDHISSERLAPLGARPIAGTKKTKYEFAGVGALVQLIGFVAVWFFPLGTFAGIALLLIGSSMSKRIFCSECGNKIDKESRMCPHCKVEFLE